ncbi:MAG TPA: NAD-dependent epimerase/dehydratase family protein [Chitinophagales bacterium]|nr:hypothetical protein [Bacteroidota bacterium]HRX24301.1 NAD-dependent epimerase/dehydratase family protein [Chitinophagales bacterium]
MSRILVTGATGFTGSYMVRYLRQLGHEVRILHRSESSWYLLEEVEGLEKFCGDIRDIFALSDATEGVDAVYHCAGLVSYKKEDKNRLHQINAAGTEAVVNACLDRNIPMLHLSSVAAIGKKYTRGEVITEQNKWESRKALSDYAVSKFRAEQEVWRGVAEGLQAVIVNPSIILGACDWEQSSGRLFRSVYKRYPFYTQGITGFVDVRDVVQMAHQLMEEKHFGERFLLSADNLTYQHLFETMAKYLQVPPPRWEAGPKLSGLAWRLNAILRMFGLGNKAITRTTARMANRQTRYDSSKVKSRLGMEFRSLEETIRDSCVCFLATQQDGCHHPLSFEHA